MALNTDRFINNQPSTGGQNSDFSYSYKPPTMAYANTTAWMDPNWQYERSPATTTRSYTGEGNTFSQVMPSNIGRMDSNTGRRIEAPTGFGGSWTDAYGNIVADLEGRLKKGSLRRTGSDFSQEQNMLSGLLSDPSKIQQTAGYQFDVDQGNQAINRSAAARGSLNSGGVLAELAKYGQGMASREYGNQVNRLSSLIGQKQQFGASSGYYDELNPQRTGGGGGSSQRAVAAPRPQNDPYADQANRENAFFSNQLEQGDRQRAEFAAKDQAYRDAGYR
jgi:hypothetical protein